ncbi:ATP-binding cassette domain-containing protein [Chryseolinea sp. H1M3-3]|uniref:ATP-binding cassette domain-containing protein n=1 Tax=Chryseolinea sp. H1M3-3 TaxID=3034144 RepID=UPI0023EE012E|nr:ATP-binding cassette domain-containing protein [Chryseolinea sp. H1M3-3]
MIHICLKKKLFSSRGDMNLDVDFKVNTGELVTLYGASGAGKTTLLRMVCGLTNPDGGSVMVQDETWFDHEKKINLKPQQRNVGIVFQDYALFPNMTVRENLTYALGKNQSKDIVNDLLELMELTSFHDKKPGFLSGGQRQRVAIARALVRRPKILLLDEPMSALDTVLRLKIQDYILQVHRQYNLTTILVSHDIFEVIRLSKHVYLMEQGKIVREGAPAAVLPLQTLRRLIEGLPKGD